jgi:hypothetical protein
VHRAGLAEIGEAARRPQPADPAALGPLAHLGILGEPLQHREVDRFGRGAKARIVRLFLRASGSAPRRSGNRVALAPVEMVERRKRCSSIASISSGRNSAESSPSRPSVPNVPSFWWRPARPAICAISADGQAAVAAAVELGEAGEGDMGHVHVEAHADGVGGDEIIDLAALEHRDLGVAGGGARARPSPPPRRP